MKIFSIKEAVGTGWGIVKNHLWFSVGTTLIYLIFNYNSRLPKNSVLPNTMLLGLFALMVLLYFVKIIVQIGFIKTYLKLLDGVKPSVRELFSHVHPFWRYVGSIILLGL